MSRRPGNTPPGGGGSRGWPRPGYPRAAAAAAAVAVAAGVAAFALRRPEPPRVGAAPPPALGEAHAAAVRGWKARRQVRKIKVEKGLLPPEPAVASRRKSGMMSFFRRGK